MLRALFFKEVKTRLHFVLLCVCLCLCVCVCVAGGGGDWVIGGGGGGGGCWGWWGCWGMGVGSTPIRFARQGDVESVTMKCSWHSDRKSRLGFGLEWFELRWILSRWIILSNAVVHLIKRFWLTHQRQSQPQKGRFRPNHSSNCPGRRIGHKDAIRPNIELTKFDRIQILLEIHIAVFSRIVGLS